MESGGKIKFIMVKRRRDSILDAESALRLRTLVRASRVGVLAWGGG